MALPKRTRIGGGYYRGYVCIVSSAPGNYTTLITNTSGAAMNGVSITPDDYGAGDMMRVVHHADVAGTGRVMAIIAEDLYNVGKSASIMLDFPEIGRAHV